MPHGRRRLGVADIERPTVEAEFEMPDALHVAQSRRVLGLGSREESVLPHQGADMGNGIAQRNDESRIGKKFDQRPETHQVVVFFREKAPAPPQP